LELHAWLLKTAVFQDERHLIGGNEGVDNDFASRSFENVGAWILGRNMFGPVRAAWKDDSWKGWWGDEPPYHVLVFVLTHYARAPLVMKGGTTFCFVTDGIESALEQAQEAAKGQDVRIGGGVSTIRQYVTANLVDEIHLAFSSVLPGEGEICSPGLTSLSSALSPCKRPQAKKRSTSSWSGRESAAGCARCGSRATSAGGGGLSGRRFGRGWSRWYCTS
jgi:dihydrofolate reductase